MAFQQVSYFDIYLTCLDISASVHLLCKGGRLCELKGGVEFNEKFILKQKVILETSR